MRVPLKNWSLQISQYCLSFFKQKAITCLLLLFFLSSKAQIVNYINNGGLEEYYNCSSTDPNSIKYWTSTDSICYPMGRWSYCLGNVPNQFNTEFQLPRNGKTFVGGTFYYTSFYNGRRYIRNRLKSNLQPGKTYCVKLYVNIMNTTTYGNDGFGIYFGSNGIDTITKCDIPLSYLTPQVKCPSGSPITDTLGWTVVTGTFVANGTEKYALLGIFAKNGMVDTALVNPTYMSTTGVFTDACIDDVSCIELDLPAFAGRDTFFIPGDSIYLGRPSDVGIDEDCMWYKLPNTTTAVDTVAGFWLKPTTTCTYVVKQDICGVIKWDTIVLYQSAIGINEIDFYSQNIKLYPQPAQDVLNIKFNFNAENEFTKCVLYNNLGQIIREEKLEIKEKIAIFNLTDLSSGVYFITLSNQSHECITKKLFITR